MFCETEITNTHYHIDTLPGVKYKELKQKLHFTNVCGLILFYDSPNVFWRNVYVFGGCVVGGIRLSKKKESVSALEIEAGKDIKEKN